ncbi:MAG TPA: RHS repeat-associated core domain-containing protein [Pyrinomonadaceae bacterium]|nr:RHS repeat-associated core domain-containing protein [Pyrinomonadaceae bacterium]
MIFKKCFRSLTVLRTRVLRTICQPQILSATLCLFIQYSLVISLMTAPLQSTVRAQDNRTSIAASTTRLNAQAIAHEYVMVDDKRVVNLFDNKTSKDTRRGAQDPPRPTVVPPEPGIGRGGQGEGGSFSVDPPERRQGPPADVRRPAEVLNDVHTTPTIPDPIPSTQTYCWPGDPECRKKPGTGPRPPAARPTPPPRPESSSVAARQADLLIASNDGYIEKVTRSLGPYLPHLLMVGDSAGAYSRLNAEPGLSIKQLLALTSRTKGTMASGSASYIWADCNNVEGYADNAQGTVYIYVDSLNVGQAWADGSGYFIHDISSYVMDGGFHSISAWYYTWDWIWLEAGSTSVSGCGPTYDFCVPRLNPKNDTGDPGVDPGSQNINWSIPLVRLPGRGLDLDLLLTYNSLVWTKSSDGGAMMFDPDHGFPSPGFRLRFPIIQPAFFNPEANSWSYMLVGSSGERIELRHVSGNIYESADSSYTRLVDYGNGTAIVWLQDGTQLKFEPALNGELRCNEIKDRNGNFIKVDYTAQSNIDKVTDTLGRQVIFNYDGNHRLLKISQVRTGLVDDLVTFGYENATFSPAFPGLTLFAPGGSTIPVLNQVGFADGTRYNFEYTTFGQVNKIRRHLADDRLVSYVRYNLGTGAQTDCPRFSEERLWNENWNNNQEAVTTYSGDVTSGLSQVTTPDAVTHKQFYHTTGWRTGLVQKTETWFAGVKRKWTEMYWTQDNEGLSHQVNPRPNDIRTFDEAGNQNRTTVEYTSFGLPSNVREYSGATVVRRRETQYRFDAAFVDRRILGVIWMELIYQGENTLQSKLNYHHDWNDAGSWNGQTPSTGHDTANYGSGFTWGRANVTGIRRYNLQAPNDDNQAVWIKRVGYNAAGMPFLVRDAASHSTSMSYTDSFSDNINRGTLAYPTTVTDAENFSTTIKYHYDIGTITRIQDPKGAVQTTVFDTVGRQEQVTNETTGGYTRWYYTPVGEVVTVTRVDATQPETMSVHYVDGGGRARGTIRHLPNTSGGWRAQTWAYDIMGRVNEQSNPTEVTQGWVPAGEDAGGWIHSQQTYDWLGRPRITTNQDGSTRELTYTGCGCAGGDVTTIRDERGRRRKLTNDVLGRLVKVEELNWDQSVYSTTNYTYNARDQLTESNQAGQLRSFSYDAHGRLLTRTTPEQGPTTYGYNVDDTVQTITDARGAVMTFGYNPRKLVNGVTFTVPGGVAATPNVTFGYDSAGNRTSMSSSESTVTYGYDTASRLTSESRTFNGLAGSFTLGYAYNPLGQLTEITNPWNVKVGYTYNYAGEITGVTGENFGGVSSYASGIVYRAFGGMRQMNYANGRTLSKSYNNRMFLTQWSIPSVMRWNYAYHYFNENTGRVVYAQNLDDGTLDRAYDYDHVGRPTHFTTGSNARHFTGQGGTVLNDGPYSHGYTFDVWGNRTWIEGWGGIGRNESALYTNNRRNAFGYDAAGNVTYDLQQTMTYDATGQQATASYSGNLLQQAYDGDRLRVKKVENGTATYYLRSAALGGQIVAELNSAGTWTRGYVYLGRDLLAVQQNNQVSWVHQDPVVKSKRVTNGSGAVVSVVELDPWGGDTTRSSNESFQPQRFTTYFRDGNASDDAMHRRYNRWHMRFDQPDPFGGNYDLTNPRTFNRYTYAFNDPVNLVDPFGLDPDCADEYNATGGCTITPDGDGGGASTIIGGMIGDTGMVIEGDRPQDPPGDGGGGGGGPTVTPTPNPRPRRQLDPSHPECQALARKINNIVADLRKRAQEVLDDKLKLPLTGPGPRSTTIEGHREIIEENARNLERRRQEYKDKCGGGTGGPGGVPVSPPVVNPAPRTNPGNGPRMSPAPGWIPRFMLIPLIMMDPCLVYPHLCFKPNAE